MSKKPLSDDRPVGDIFTGEVEISDVEPKRASVEFKIENFISMQSLVPSVEWIKANVVLKGKGYEQKLAKLIGWCNKTSRNINTINNNPVQSVKLIGSFEAYSLIEESIAFKAPEVFLPMKWAELVEKAVAEFETHPETGEPIDPSAKVQMSLTLGVRATGKSIDYAWTVSTALEDTRPDRDLERLRAIAGVGPKPIQRLEHGAGVTIDAEQHAHAHATSQDVHSHAAD